MGSTNLVTSGSVQASAHTSPSDARLKTTDVGDLGPAEIREGHGGIYEELWNLQPKTFTWNASGQKDIGFIAQEVQAALAPYPEFSGIVHPVSDDSHVYLGIDYSKLSVPAIMMARNCYAEIQALGTMPAAPMLLQNQIGLANAPTGGVPAVGADNLWGLLHSLYVYIRTMKEQLRVFLPPTVIADLPDWPEPPVDFVTPR
jgi:hypothetical protein